MATALRTLDRVSGTLTGPPTPLTRFVGRELELAEIGRLLATSRLVTLIGAGGSGKTRLAAEAVRRAVSERGTPEDGVAWVDLSLLSRGGQLPRHACAALGLAESLEHTALESIVAGVRGLSLLLVLDNCEHVVSECAGFAHALLAECPGLRIMATSREALGVEGETSWVVPPLSLPASADPTTAEGIAHSEAVQLFVARAQAAFPGFNLTDGNAPAVAHVCRQLDGIPLAIELAAARMNVLPVEHLVRRLDDVFGLLTSRSRTTIERHRTLRDAIAWSHDLLAEHERIFFRRLAVFRGGFTLEAAEGVCLGSAGEVFDVVTALVEKSLVRSEAIGGEARFSLLEPIRQYAWERLGEAGEAEELRNRHAAYFVALAERAEPHVRGGTRGTEWMVRLERDQGNLGAAAEWCAEDPTRVELQLRLDSALLWFYFAQGYFREPRRRLTEALARADGLSRLVLGRAYVALGYQAIWQGDYGAVAEPLQNGVALLRPESDTDALSFALTGLGTAVGLGGDAAASYALFDEAQALLGGLEGSSERGFPALLLYAFASYWRGVVALAQGDTDLARSALEVSLAVARDLGNHASGAHPRTALVLVLTLQGALYEARECLVASLPVHSGNDDRWGVAETLEGAAHLAAAEGEPARAARLLGAADALRESIGLFLPPQQHSHRARLTKAIRASIGDQELKRAFRVGQELPLEAIVREALGSVPSVAGPAPAPHGVSAASAPDAPMGHPQPAAVDAALTVLALGPLEIRVHGEAPSSTVWGSAKPRELLLYLLCHPDGATREQIGQALWPESPSERVVNSFHVTVHRLRKALGDAGWITRAGERYVVAPDRRVFFDAAIFERDVKAALRRLQAGDSDLESLRTALDLHRGGFLQDEVVGDWHLEIRDRLQRVHVDGLLALGARLFGAGVYGEAAQAYWRVIADDDLHEEAYRQLMLSLARAGDRSQALRLYQRLCTLLDEELGARPEPLTVALFEQLQQPGDP